MAEQLSFLSLLEAHERLSDMFVSHQEALLELNIALAVGKLRQFEREIRAHMRIEEDLLLPVYARAGRIQGGPIEFYTGEHRRMLDFLARFANELNALSPATVNVKRRIIELLDQEAVFKQLMQHHDMRERNLLYPTLDKVTTDDERRQLLANCQSIAASGQRIYH